MEPNIIQSIVKAITLFITTVLFAYNICKAQSSIQGSVAFSNHKPAISASALLLHAKDTLLVKAFTGSSPSVFVKETPLLETDFTKGCTFKQNLSCFYYFCFFAHFNFGQTQWMLLGYLCFHRNIRRITCAGIFVNSNH